MAYATAEDFAAQYPDCEVDEDTLELLLQQASDAIDMAFRARGIELPSEMDDELLLRVCARVACQLVYREVCNQSSGLPFDATQASWTAGSYSQSYTLSGSGTNLKLNSADLTALGLNGGTVLFSGSRNA